MDQKKINFWQTFFWQYLFYAYFSCGLQLVLVITKHSMIGGLRDSLIYTLLCLIPGLIFPKYCKKIALILGIILWLTSLIPISYFCIYRQEFSQSVFFVMSESNLQETSEYLQQYFSITLLITIIIYSLIAFWLWTHVRPFHVKYTKRLLLGLLIIFLTVILPFFNCLLIKNKNVDGSVKYIVSKMETTLPWQLLISFNKYHQQLTNMHALLKHYESVPPILNLSDSNGNMPRTLVLVIGESTTRTRMSLYGYERNTTPLLDQLYQQDKNLIKFNDVITSRPYTIEVLQQVLTFADEHHPDLYLQSPSIIQIMKQAGYKTYWITNQQTMTARNTMLTMFSQQADKQFYLNNDRNQNSRQYDEVVLEPFKQVLNDQDEKKFIIVHLLGTHMNYRYRFPEQYKRFTSAPKNFNLDNKELEHYNNYDNAESYNDFVLSQLIHTFADSKPNGFLLYFSDHGEDVYESPSHDVLGRNEKAPTEPMYTIPFLLWISPQWQQTHAVNYQQYTNRKYSTADFIHTWSDLAGLNYNLYEPSKSLVNPAFVETTRWIGDPYAKNGLHDFDKLFRK
ncbi:phosphoethanolamine transferase CptA [Frischella sp. Ac48]|uniref:phosphoethanolamine transferase CptA n=1 Tax=Frischella sp. Ac48 TaxID=2804531 RepID=UPI001C7CBE09|nr:phosphoethanolamine transferase CptA [Frischella sp. Ac48]MBX4133549.1 phosphoethanolamine transferase CptA [Frischella sp. Ac48]